MRLKKLTPAVMIEYAESLAAHLPAQIHSAGSLPEARDLYEGCGYVLEGLKDEGYSVLLIEAIRTRVKNAMLLRRFDDAESAAKNADSTPNRHGLNMGYFTNKLRNMINLMHSYTPAEFARECGRMARTADENVLREEEFQ